MSYLFCIFMRLDTMQDMVRHCQLGKALWLMRLHSGCFPSGFVPTQQRGVLRFLQIPSCQRNWILYIKYKRSTFPKVARVHGHSQELTQPGFKQLCLDLLCPKMISISGFCIHSLGFSHKNTCVLGSPQRLQVTSSAATSPTIERLNRQSEFHFGANFGMFWKFEHGIIEQSSTISPGGQDKAPRVNVGMCCVVFCVLFPDGALFRILFEWYLSIQKDSPARVSRYSSTFGWSCIFSSGLVLSKMFKAVGPWTAINNDNSLPKSSSSKAAIVSLGSHCIFDLYPRSGLKGPQSGSFGQNRHLNISRPKYESSIVRILFI